MKNKEIAPHKKLLVWQKAFELTKEVYKITEKFPKEEMFGITQQIRRAAVSVVSNIAEGASRISNKEKIQFFITSRSSLAELETQLLLAKELKYFDEVEIFFKIEEVGKLLNGIIQNRRKCVKYLVLIIFTVHYLLFTTCCIFSAFQNTDWSVRAESMGGVFTAVSDEPSGIYYNPAGITAVDNNYIQAMYTKPYLGLEDVNFTLMSLSAVVPVKYVRLGIGSNIYDVQGGLYREVLGMVSVASMLSEIYQILPPVRVGLNLKYLNKKYSYDDEILQVEPELKGKDSKSVFSVDFGVLYKILDDKLSFGFSVKDVNQPDIAVLEGNKDIIPMTISFGSAYNFGDLKAGLYFEDFTVGVELRYRNQEWGDENTKIFYALGLETYLNFHTIPIRFGVNKNSINLGFGYQGVKVSEKVSLGVSYNFGLPIVYSDTLGNHRISIDIKF